MNIQELKSTKIVKEDDSILPIGTTMIAGGVYTLTRSISKEVKSGSNNFLRVELSNNDFFVPIPLYRGRTKFLKKSISDIVFD